MTRFVLLLRAGVLISTTLPCVLVGCTTRYVRESRLAHAESLSRLQANAITTDRVSDHTLQVLRVLDLTDLWEDDPRRAADAITAVQGGRPVWIKQMARAEIFYHLAERANEEEAELFHLEVVLSSQDALTNEVGEVSVFDPRQRLLADLYNRSLARYLAIRQERDGHPATWTSAKTLGGGTRPFEFLTGPGSLGAEDFDLLVPAEERLFSGRLAKHNRYREFGVGCSLIAIENAPEQPEPYKLPGIRSRPATATINGRNQDAILLRVLDPFVTTTVPTEKGDLPISADFTAPLAHLAAVYRPSLGERIGFFEPEKIEARAGLYFFEAYDPKKIPLVCVHGLWSGPATWMELVNEIWGDPDLRSRYQVWNYFYPTGRSIPINAAHLRQTMVRVRDDIDPEGDDVAMQNMVVVGHSMGGILSKTLVSSTGDRLEQELMTVPLADIVASEEDREWLRGMLHFEPLPFIKRVVFISTPHRGATLADSLVGRLGAFLIEQPKEYDERLRTILADNPGASRYELRGVQSSIENLSAENPMLQALCELPIRDGLPFHSIVGNIGGDDPPDCTDGIVEYRSSKLEGAVSEVVVAADHNAHQHPHALLEIRRILLEHAIGVAP
jgi:triacylglycerol esterase/lipase EstA (alpha/beta hydrolase family)